MGHGRRGLGGLGMLGIYRDMHGGLGGIRSNTFAGDVIELHLDMVDDEMENLDIMYGEGLGYESYGNGLGLRYGQGTGYIRRECRGTEKLGGLGEYDFCHLEVVWGR